MRMHLTAFEPPGRPLVSFCCHGALGSGAAAGHAAWLQKCGREHCRRETCTPVVQGPLGLQLKGKHFLLRRERATCLQKGSVGTGQWLQSAAPSFSSPACLIFQQLKRS